jgi:hypothetical protein
MLEERSNRVSGTEKKLTGDFNFGGFLFHFCCGAMIIFLFNIYLFEININ